MEKTLLISAFASYAAALALYAVPRDAFRTISFMVFAAGSIANIAAAVLRGISAGHFPFSNMYETMISLAACAFPLALLMRRKQGPGGGWIDPLLAAVMLFPSAFGVGKSFTPEVRLLPPVLQSPFFFPHVISYLIAYAAMARAFLLGLSAALSREAGKRESFERAAFHSAGIGFPLMSVGLILGAFWAKYAWGDWWSWDPKEVWALITWLVFLVYFHARPAGRKSPGWAAIMLGIGFAAMIITLLVVNLTPLFGGLHAYA